MAHTALIETSYHIKCCKCGQWWSMACYDPDSLGEATCPRCEKKDKIERAVR